MRITTPTLLVDEKKCRANIQMMADRAARHDLVLRPHFKTHQSHEIGRWFRDYGVTKITCSSLSMAEYFAEDGWADITVAFPVNVLEIDTINRLASRLTLNLLVESTEAVWILKKGLNHSVNLLIKLDLGTHRTGVDPENLEAIQKIIDTISESSQTAFLGFLSHAGHSYKCRSREEILAVHEEAMERLAKLKGEFPEACFSYGDSPTCSHAEEFGMVDEIRPGNFAFYDLMQVQIGSCYYDQVSVAMACPVVAIHPERNEVVVYGGGVHFSKDRMEIDGRVVYGQAVESEGEGWGNPIDGVMLDRISQEHGVIKGTSEWVASVKIGDIVKVLPVHSCMTMDLLRSFKKV